MAVYLGENKVCTKGGTKVLLSDISLQDKTVTPSTSIQTIKPDNDYDGLSSVTVNAINIVTQATPSISISDSGLITASSTQSAGYVTSGTKNSTKQLTTKSTATITPSTSSQTIASGTYLTGTQTIKGDSNLIARNIKNGTSIFGVTGTYVGSGSGGIDTSDATATASDIANGVTAYANGKKITGMINTVKSGVGYTPSDVTASKNGTDIRLRVDLSTDKLLRSGSYVALDAPLSGFGNATASDVIKGKTFTSAAGLKVTGTFEDVEDGEYIWKKHIGKVWDVTTTHLGTTAPSDYSGFIYGDYIATDDGYFLLKGKETVLGDGLSYIKGKGAETHPKSVYQLTNTYSYPSGFTKNYYRLDIGDTYTEGKGSFIGYVSSDDSSAYPDDGLKDGYYYVKIQEGTSSGSGTDTSDATATAADILTGKTAYGKDGKLTGSMTNNGAVNKSISGKSESYTIPKGYHNGSGKVAISESEQAKIIASNIKKGISILGVTGSYEATSSSGSSENNCEAYLVDVLNPTVSFKKATGTIKAYGYAYATTKSQWGGSTTTTIYAFNGTNYYKSAAYGSPTATNITLGVSGGKLTGLPSDLSGGTLLVTRGI